MPYVPISSLPLSTLLLLIHTKRIEHFFSSSVTHVITNQPQPPKNEQYDPGNKENIASRAPSMHGGILKSPIQLKGRCVLYQENWADCAYLSLVVMTTVDTTSSYEMQYSLTKRSGAFLVCGSPLITLRAFYIIYARTR